MSFTSGAIAGALVVAVASGATYFATQSENSTDSAAAGTASVQGKAAAHFPGIVAHTDADFKTRTAFAPLFLTSSSFSSNLSNLGWNDTISSIQNDGDRSFCAYMDRDFRGLAAEIPPHTNIAFTGSYAMFNDKVSSIKPC
ncbi:hypothetical protein [Streptomyces bauhiniae]